MSTPQLNDELRWQYIEREAELFDWYQFSGLRRRDFIRRHRHDIDALIHRIAAARNPADYFRNRIRFGGWLRLS